MKSSAIIFIIIIIVLVIVGVWYYQSTRTEETVTNSNTNVNAANINSTGVNANTNTNSVTDDKGTIVDVSELENVNVESDLSEAGTAETELTAPELDTDISF